LKKFDIKRESTTVPASLRPTFGQLSSIIRFHQMQPCNRLSSPLEMGARHALQIMSGSKSATAMQRHRIRAA
jgi:hypothetical protein